MSRKEILKKLAEKFPTSRDNNTEDIKVENCIGFARVPLALAGPLTIHGNHERTVWGPLATLEATLVASCSRGCKAFQASGGIKAAVLSENLSRAPFFTFGSVEGAVKFYHLVPTLQFSFKASCEKSSRFARLIKLTPHIIGKSVHVKFDYTCGDAGGQNMVTLATHRACQEFLASDAGKNLGVIDFVVEGQFASDKKASWENVKNGRGVEVMVWGSVSDAVCRKILGTSTTRLHTVISKYAEGSTRAGHIGTNINTSNILAAMFIACGQDAASVFESGYSHLISDLDEKTKELTLSLYFPALLIGTIGGGTNYPTQREALESIGCYGEGKKFALAETIAAFALALDISTISAMSNDTFTKSHQDLARVQTQSKL